MYDMLRKILGCFLLILGLFGLIASFFVGYIGEQKNKEIIQNFELYKNVENNDYNEKTEDYLEEENNDYNDDIIAILSIPSVDIKYPVMRGTSSDVLKKSLGYFENTALPGEKGNFAVAGHRNSSYAKFFNRLDEVEKGDEIIVETKNNEYVYVVEKSFEVHETETYVLEQTSDATITLITCVNGFNPKYRIIIQGYLKEGA